jgi:site-specific DNA-methyltransferase (adenine-specific)
MELGKEVQAVYHDAVDELEMRQLELEANFHRKDFTPAEQAFAVRDLHRLMESQHGKSHPGASGGWTLDDTAKKLKVSRGSVIEKFKLAEIVDAFPELKNAKKATDIKKAAKALTKLNMTVQGFKKHEEYLKEKEVPFELHCKDALDFMATVEDGSVDIVLTDPLYGIEHHRVGIGGGGETGGRSGTGYKFDDSVEPALRGYDFLAQESFRFTTNTAQAYVFLAMEHFNGIKDLFRKAGWRVYVKPIIWVKRETGQCNLPTHWPADCYEAILFARKDESRLLKEGMPNWIECLPLNPSEKIHQYEKPVALLDNLLKRSALPGSKLIDPFMGSASAIEAGIKRNLYCIGVDNSQEAYAFAVERMARVSKEIKN